MLTLIPPRERDHNQEKIESFLNFFKIYQGLDIPLSLQKKSTFLIAENDEYGVYGGAFIYPKKVTLLYEKVSRALLKFIPKVEEVWCFRLCFCVEQKEGYHTLETLAFYETFYQDLYKALSKWGQQHHTPFLVLTLGYREYKDSKTYGKWPYLLEVNCTESSDHNFHGLLILEGQEDNPLLSPQRTIQ